MAARGRAGGRFRVLVADPVADAGLEVLRKHPRFEVVVRTRMSPAELKAALAEADALVVRSETRVTADVLPANGRLKVVGRAGVGIDNVDVAAATKAGILVMNAPEGNTIAAAEHTMAMILSLARNVPQAHASLRAGEWKRGQFVGHELFQKTLGVVGLGRIGAEVTRRALSFGMNVLAHDPFVTPERARALGVELVGTDALFRRADVVTLHAPLVKGKPHLLGAREIKLLKRDAYVVNCARGGLLDERALAAAIKAGRVAGAALDVFESEPPDRKNPLLGLSRVVVTPHLGASTAEAQVNVARVIAHQVRDYLLEGLVQNAVNAPAASPEVMKELAPYLRLAERVGRFLVQLAAGAPKQITVEYRGDLAARGNLAIVTAAAVKGVLSVALPERVTYINALAIAKERGIEVQEGKSSESGDFASSVLLRIRTAAGQRSMEGTVIGKDEPHVVGIDELHLDVVPDGVMIIFTNVDRPGIVGKVGTILGKAKINIAGLHLGRVAIGKRAVSIFSVDNEVPPAVVHDLATLAELSDVKVVKV